MQYRLAAFAAHHAARIQLTGWILFVLSAGFFIAASIRAGDLIGLIGGILFLVSCFVFLLALVPMPVTGNAGTGVRRQDAGRPPAAVDAGIATPTLRALGPCPVPTAPGFLLPAGDRESRYRCP